MRTYQESEGRLHDHPNGLLRACIDGRFVVVTREAFQDVTGLGEHDYYYAGNAGGVGAPISESIQTEDDLVLRERGVRIAGWQGHLNICGRYPGESDADIKQRIFTGFMERVDRYPDAAHYLLIARLGKDGKRYADVYFPDEVRKMLRATNIPLGGNPPRRSLR